MSEEIKITHEEIDIPKYKMDYLIKKIEAFNRKAVKLGCEMASLTFDNEHVLEYDEHPLTGFKLLTPIKLEMVTAHLQYVIPRIEGYELVAKLDIFSGKDEDVVLVSPVPDMDVPEKYMNANKIQCDHCGYKRNRHHSVLLKKVDSDEYKEVGSTCVKDFFGVDPRGFMLMASLKFDYLVDSFDEEKFYSGGSRGIFAYGINEVIAFSSACMRKWGWKSRGVAYEYGGVATSEHVLDNLSPYPKMPKEAFVSVSDSDYELAEKIEAFFGELDPEDNNYLITLCNIVKLGYVPSKYMGYACSMVIAYEKQMETKEKADARKKELESMPESNFVGNVGERLKGIKVECIFNKDIESDWGESSLYTFRDALGNIYKTFYSGSSWSTEKGEVMEIDGTVKKHCEWKGQKQTMLNRVAVREISKEEYEAFTADEFKVS